MIAASPVLSIFAILLSYLGSPYVVALEVEADAHVLVVGVDATCTFRLPWSPIVLAYLLGFVATATASDILTIASDTQTVLQPLGCCSDIAEVIPTPIIRDCYHLLTTAACHVRPPVLVAVLVEVTPALCRSLHGSFAHVVRPLLALVGRNVTFEELSVLLIDARPHWGQCQFAITHTLIAKSITHLVEPCSDNTVIIGTATIPLAMIGYFGNPTITIASLHSHTANTPHAASVSVLTTARTSPVVVNLCVDSSFSLHVIQTI